jgi:hypothetical protein
MMSSHGPYHPWAGTSTSSLPWPCPRSTMSQLPQRSTSGQLSSPISLYKTKSSFQKITTILQRGPYLFAESSCSPPNIPNRTPGIHKYFQISPSHFPDITDRSLKLFSPYIFNRNSESCDSYAKILRITFSLSSSYSYSYYCCIYMIVCLSIRIIHSDIDVNIFKINYMRISRPNIWGLWSFLVKATREVSVNILHLNISLSVL